MRQLFSILTLASACFIISCNSNSGGMSDTAKKNKEVNDAIMNDYYAGNFSKMGDYIAKDAIDHAGEMGDVKGVDSIVAQMKRYNEQATADKHEIIQEFANDDYVMVWSKVSMTLKTDGMGKKAGDKMEMTSVDVSRFKDGKAVEHWVFMDPNEMMKMMMGNMPMANPTATDGASPTSAAK